MQRGVLAKSAGLSLFYQPTNADLHLRVDCPRVAISGTRRVGPSDQRGKRECARRFERLCCRALAEELISLTKAAELLRLPVSEVEAGTEKTATCRWGSSLAIAVASSTCARWDWFEIGFVSVNGCGGAKSAAQAQSLASLVPGWVAGRSWQARLSATRLG